VFPCRSIRKQSAVDNLNQGGRLKSEPLYMCGEYNNMQVMSYVFYRVKQFIMFKWSLLLKSRLKVQCGVFVESKCSRNASGGVIPMQS